MVYEGKIRRQNNGIRSANIYVAYTHGFESCPTLVRDKKSIKFTVTRSIMKLSKTGFPTVVSDCQNLYRRLVEYGNVWRWPHVGRQYRTLVAYESSMSGLHIGRYCRKCVEYRCIWSGHQYRTIVMKLPSFKNSHFRQTWLFLPARAWDIILGSGRERARAKKSSSLHSVCLGSLKLERNWIWLASVRRWAVSLVTDYFFIQFYVSAIFHNDWTPEMKRWKETFL